MNFLLRINTRIMEKKEGIKHRIKDCNPSDVSSLIKFSLRPSMTPMEKIRRQVQMT